MYAIRSYYASACPESGNGGERRTESRHAAASFDRCDQCGFLTADERTGAFLDLDMEIESAVEDVVAEQPPPFGLGYRLPETRDVV